MRSDDGPRRPPEPGDEPVDALLADLAQQADGLRMAERDLEVAELGRAEFSQVTLQACLRGSVGRRLQMTVLGVGRLSGSLDQVGDGWVLLRTEPGAWWVTAAGVSGVRGSAWRPTAASGVADRLGLGSALRALSERAADVVVHLLDGATTAGTLTRVGADFLALRDGEGSAARDELVPFSAVAAVAAVSAR